ncbi:antA/AntB antirepressor family protein, partial [Patescibacteria group bacterium]|nr:antA/AntB antirepressor family protein [Patescibacteria group bacterium]
IKEFFNINETQYKMVEKIFKFCEQHANKTGKIIDSKTGAILPKEYVLSVDMAKELAMVENSDIGKKVKKHFPTRRCFLFFTAKLPPLTGE